MMFYSMFSSFFLSDAEGIIEIERDQTPSTGLPPTTRSLPHPRHRCERVEGQIFKGWDSSLTCWRAGGKGPLLMRMHAAERVGEQQTHLQELLVNALWVHVANWALGSHVLRSCHHISWPASIWSVKYIGCITYANWCGELNRLVVRGDDMNRWKGKARGIDDSARFFFWYAEKPWSIFTIEEKG